MLRASRCRTQRFRAKRLRSQLEHIVEGRESEDMKDPHTPSDAPRDARGHPTRRDRGMRAEALAAVELARLGYRIVARNARIGRHEIDCIAMEAGVLCFIEVRSRGSLRFGTPEASIDVRKQRRIIEAARAWLAQRQAPRHAAIRFDVVAVDARYEPPQLRLYRAAFSAERR